MISSAGLALHGCAPCSLSICCLLQWPNKVHIMWNQHLSCSHSCGIWPHLDSLRTCHPDRFLLLGFFKKWSQTMWLTLGFVLFRVNSQSPFRGQYSIFSGLSAEAAELPFQFGLLILETLPMGLQIGG